MSEWLYFIHGGVFVFIVIIHMLLAASLVSGIKASKKTSDLLDLKVKIIDELASDLRETHGKLESYSRRVSSEMSKAGMGEPFMGPVDE